MKHIYRIFLFLVLISVCTTTTAHSDTATPDIIYSELPFLNQLPTKEITTLYQDSEGFVWIGTADGLGRYDGYDTKIFRSDYNNPSALTSNYIKSISETEQYICIGTREGLNLIDKKTLSISKPNHDEIRDREIHSMVKDQAGNLYVSAENAIYKYDASLKSVCKLIIDAEKRKTATGLFTDDNNVLWAMVWGGGLYRYDEGREIFEKMPKIGEKDNPIKMIQDHDGRYWVCTWGDGFFRFNPEYSDSRAFIKQNIGAPATVEEDIICFDVIQDNNDGLLWLLSYHKLCVLEVNDEDNVEEAKIDGLNVFNRTFSNILKDRNGNLWIGAFDAGYSVRFRNKNLNNYPLGQIIEKYDMDVNINALGIDDDGIFWINQERVGLRFYDTVNDSLVFSDENIYKETEVNRIVSSGEKNTMWISSPFIPVIFRATRENDMLVIKDTVDLRILDRYAATVNDMAEDAEGNLWINSGRDIYLRSACEGNLTIVEGDYCASALRADKSGNIIFADRNMIKTISIKNIPNGIGVHTDMETLVEMPYKLTGKECFSHISNIDNESLLAATSLGTIFFADLENGKCRNVTTLFNPDCDPIRALWIKDGEIATVFPNHILIRNHESGTSEIYKCSNIEIPVSSMKDKTFIEGRNNIIYAGGHKGIFGINKGYNNKTDQKAKRVPVISDIKISSKSIFTDNDENGKVKNSRSEIMLSGKDKNIEISFSDLDFELSGQNEFSYKLAGIDNDYVTLKDGANIAFYNNLPKGTYKFYVRREGHGGKNGSEKALLTIHRLPSWYETTIANIVYLIIFILIVVYISRVFIARAEKRNRLKMLEELTRSKIEYFTNVSHELLTPLTILSCSIDNIENTSEKDNYLIRTMRENINRLNKLIQLVLDFRKADAGKLTLKESYNNISENLTNLIDTNFILSAEQKNISIETDIDENICGVIDRDKFDMILFNLISNAIKYSYEETKIDISLKVLENEGMEYAQLKVKDEGMGIEKKELGKIFTRFYVNDKNPEVKSNGIGLSLTKELVELHEGDIIVKSEKGKGSEFIVIIPLKKEIGHENVADKKLIGDNKSEASIAMENRNDRETILVIDDNTTLLNLISGILSEKFNVICCSSAVKGEEIIRNENINLILCDIMMPEINGLDFCKAIKTDIDINHIPVVIMTAQNNEEARIDSYMAGADSYITKPFDRKVLLARVENLLNSSKLCRKKFKTVKETDLKSIAFRDSDQLFLNRVIECIETHLSDSDFDLDFIVSQLGVSKSTFNRKIRAITDMTPMDFVKNIKMKFACKLLRNKDFNISEVAYEVGFSNPKYFATCFKEEFGMTPTEFQSKEPADVKN